MTLPPRWNELTAVFGGTFDPPHVGHREALRGVFKDPGIGRALVLPCPSPAYKPCQASPEQRMEMAKLNFSSKPGDAFPEEVEVSPLELERARRDPGRKTYSYDTLLELGREHPRLAFVIGADQLLKMPEWYRFPEVLGLSHWIVLARRPDGQEKAMQPLREWEASGLVRKVPGSPDTLGGVWQVGSTGRFLRLTETLAPAISSTQIRESISRSGRPPEGSLLPEVHAYLMQNRLYGSNGASRMKE